MTASERAVRWGRLFAALAGDLTTGQLALSMTLPIAAAAWLLVGGPWVYSRQMTWDLLYNLSGAWQLQQGHVLHVDFHDPLGILAFLPTRLGFSLVGLTPRAFLAGEALVAVFIAAAGIVAAARRLAPIAAGIFVLYTTLLVLMPVNVGDQPNVYAFAMSYNRWGWSALTTLFLLLFVEPRAPRKTDWLDAPLAGTLLLFLFFLKITYAITGFAAMSVAIVVMAHTRRHWRVWFAVLVLLLVNAAAPYNYAYYADVAHAATSGQVRGVGSERVLTVLNNKAEFAMHLTGVLVLTWCWSRGWAPARAVVAGVAIVGGGVLALSQNQQSGDIPVGIVIVMLLYEVVRRRMPEAGAARQAGEAALFGALLIWPVLSVTSQFATLAGYSRAAARDAGVARVQTTNLRGLAVPRDDRTDAEALARTGHQLLSSLRLPPMRDQLTQAEYVQTLMEASGRFLSRAASKERILVLDQVNPLPFMLEYPAPRTGNLWLLPESPARAADEVFGNVDVVLIPRYSTDARTTIFALTEYGEYLMAAFSVRDESPSWTFLRRRTTPPGRTPTSVSEAWLDQHLDWFNRQISGG